MFLEKLVSHILFKSLPNHTTKINESKLSNAHGKDLIIKDYLNTQLFRPYNTSIDLPEDWREELLGFFTEKLPKANSYDGNDLFTHVYLALKNGLKAGDSIILNNNVVCLSLSGGIMVKIYSYSKVLGVKNQNLFKTFFRYSLDRNGEYNCDIDNNIATLFSTGGYDTRINLPFDMIIATKNNIFNISFEASSMLLGSIPFHSSLGHVCAIDDED